MVRLEVAAHGVAHLSVQMRQVIGLGDNGDPDGAGDETAFEGLFNDKVDFGHG